MMGVVQIVFSLLIRRKHGKRAPPCAIPSLFFPSKLGLNPYLLHKMQYIEKEIAFRILLNK